MRTVLLQAALILAFGAAAVVTEQSLALAALPGAPAAEGVLSSSSGRSTLTPQQKSFLNRSIRQARASQRSYGIPASVVIAQAILESGWGGSPLARSTNNLFGMTCDGDSPGPIATECRQGTDRYCNATGCHPYLTNFRVYRSTTDSFRDHGLKLATAERYAAARAYRRDPKRFAIELQRAGYATNPRYAELLTRIMSKYSLYRYNAR